MGKAGKAILGAAIVAGVGALAGAGFGLGGVKFFGLTGLKALFAHAALGGVLSGISLATASKPKTPSYNSLSYEASSRTQQVRQPITTHKVIYGEVRTSGALTYGTSTENNKYLHFVITLAAHEVAGIDEVWLDDEVVPNDWLDTNGLVTQGKFAGKVRIRKHLGSADQLADSALVAEVSEWTASHRGRGCAYVYVRYELDRTLFPNGAPNLSAVIRGKKIYDPRIALDRWTPNMALIADDYLRNQQYGLEVTQENLSEPETVASANACDEIVATKDLDCKILSIDTATGIITLEGTILQFQRGGRIEFRSTSGLPDGISGADDYYIIPYQFKGTPRVKLASSLDNAYAGISVPITSAGTGTLTLRRNGEPRYIGGGVLDTAQPHGEHLKDILSGMAGKAVETGGLWKLFAGVWRAPSVTLDEDHMISPLQYTSRRSRQQRFNTVKGVFVSPINNWQPTDYPIVSNAAHVAADRGRKLLAEKDLPFTQSVPTAQRIITIALNAHRQEIVADYTVNLTGIQFQPGSTVGISNRRSGWTDKPFEVMAWKMTMTSDDKEPVIGIGMTLEETAAGVFSWNSENELLVDPAPNTNLPSAFDVSPPTGLSIDSIQMGSRDGDILYQAVVTWTPHPNASVRQGGQIQFEYKEQGQPETQWLAAKPVWGDALRADLFTGSLGTVYDIRARALNSKGVPSPWNSSLSGFTLGTAGGVGEFIDYGSVTDSPTEFADYGSVEDVPDEFDDYGSVSG